MKSVGFVRLLSGSLDKLNLVKGDVKMSFEYIMIIKIIIIIL